MVTLTTLQNLYDDAVSLRFFMDDITVGTDKKQLRDSVRQLMESIRKISIATLLMRKQVICITGLQGVGKSSLIKTLYDLPYGLLNIGNRIGEKVPVIISEIESCAEPKAYKVVLEKNPLTQKYEERSIEISAGEFCESSASRDSETAPLYMKLEVPFRIIRNEITCFMLLPGFERAKDYWRQLLDFSVGCSDSCIFALTEEKLSNIKNDEILKSVSHKIGFTRMIFAVTHSETYSEKDKSELRKRIQEKCPSDSWQDDRVLFTTTGNPNWIEDFCHAVETYTNDMGSVRKKLMDELSVEIDNLKDVREIIQECIDNRLTDNQISQNEVVKIYLDDFTKRASKWSNCFSENLKNYLDDAKNKSIKRMQVKLSNNQKKYYVHGIKRRLFGNSINDLDRAQKLIEDALKDDKSPDIPAYKLAFAKAVGELFKQSIIESIETLQLPSKKRNPFLPSTEEKSVLPTGELSKDDQVLVEKSKTVLSDVQLLLYGAGKSGTVLQNDNHALTVEIALQCIVYEFGKNFLRAVNNDVAGGSQIIRAVNLRETLFSVEEFEKTLNRTEKTVSTTVATFNKLYSHLTGEKLKDLSTTAKTGLGMAAIAAADYIPDGSFDLIPGLASLLHLTPGQAAGIFVGILTAAVAVSMIRTARRDLIEFQREAEGCISAVYDAIKDECVKKFQASVIDANIERIDRNLSSLFGVHENFIAYINTQIVLQRIKNNLRTLKKEVRCDDDFGLFITT